MPTPESCSSPDCDRPARMAIRTTRPQRDNVVVTVWTDSHADKVPAKAPRYCREHGADMLADFVRVLVDGDD